MLVMLLDLVLFLLGRDGEDIAITVPVKGRMVGREMALIDWIVF